VDAAVAARSEGQLTTGQILGKETPMFCQNSPTLDQKSHALDQKSPVLDQKSPALDQKSPVLDQKSLYSLKEWMLHQSNPRQTDFYSFKQAPHSVKMAQCCIERALHPFKKALHSIK